MNILTFDIGNTNFKIDIWNDSGHIYHTRASNYTLEELKSVIRQFKVVGVQISSVRNSAYELAIELGRLDGVKVNLLSPKDSVGFGLVESYEGRLGTDRFAAFLGASSSFRNEAMIIVDAGTALTIDAVNKDGKFCGGNISLGLYSRLKALHDYTARLPLVNPEGIVDNFGTSTENAIRSGAILGVIGEILFAFQIARKTYGARRIVLTGGDSPFIIPWLEKEGVNFLYDNFLVGRGLNYYFRNAGK